jgi:molecular chaperone HtpG
MELQKNKVQLYCNQVFITEQLEGVIPEFMMLLHGVIDSPDIPLNVSRSYLQSDANVKKIATHITKKVAEKLEEMFKNDRADFEKKWDDLKVFIQYGSITDESFYDKAAKFFLLKNSEGKYFTLEEYKTYIETLQKDKHGNLVYLYTSDVNTQHIYIQAAKEKGYDVLFMDGFLDIHFINLLERKNEKSQFMRVDADIIDNLIEKEDAQPSKLSESEEKTLKELFSEACSKTKFIVEVAHLSENDLPIMLTQNEFMRRFHDMDKISGQNSFDGGMEFYTLIVNGNHAFSGRILQEKDTERQKFVIQQLIDLALLSQNLLTGENLSEFVRRSAGLIY